MNDGVGPIISKARRGGIETKQKKRRLLFAMQLSSSTELGQADF
jgi:hypothetical protein